MTHDINHETKHPRFSTSVDGHLCVLDYHLMNAVMTITHTGVPTALGGQGIAAALTKVARGANLLICRCLHQTPPRVRRSTKLSQSNSLI
jgi:hypothetical protein